MDVSISKKVTEIVYSEKNDTFGLRCNVFADPGYLQPQIVCLQTSLEAPLAVWGASENSTPWIRCVPDPVEIKERRERN